MLTQEGEGWFASKKVASLADVFVNNRVTLAGPRAADGRMARVATTGATEVARAAQNYQSTRGGQIPPGQGGYGGTRSPTRMGQVKCYSCANFGHMARDCASGKSITSGGFRGGLRGGYRGPQRGNHQIQSGGVHVNLCCTIGPPSGSDTREIGIQSDDDMQVNFVAPNQWEFCDFPVVETVCSEKSVPSVYIYPLQYLNVNVSGCDCVALENSGCQIPIVSKRLFSWCCDDAVGKNHGMALVRITQCRLRW